MATARYWRITNPPAISGTGGDINVSYAAVQLHSALGASNLAISGNGTASASSSDVSYPAANAFDANSSTFWSSASSATQWIQWDFGAAVFVGHVKLVNPPGTSSSFTPSVAIIQRSDDGVNFTNVLTKTGLPQTNGAATEIPLPSSITVSIEAPKLVVGIITGSSVGISLPALGSSGAGGATALGVLPAIRAISTGAAVTSGASVTMPALGVASYFGGNATCRLPAVTIEAAAVFTTVARLESALPAPLLAASASVAATANASLKIPGISQLVGYSGAVLSVTIGSGPTLDASGVTGSVGGANITLPLFDLAAVATARSFGGANITLPPLTAVNKGVALIISPGLGLTAIGTAVVAVSYEAYALNLKHNPTPGVEPVDELTRYTNYPFDRIVRYKNSYFGMNSTGLYLLEGTTDFATPTPTEVPWSYKTALMDMKSVQLKNVSMAYFGGRMGPAATVSVYVGEASVAPYNYTTPRDATAQNYRQPLGKGLKSRYYAFGASGTGELTLDTLSLDVAVLARKV